MKRRMDAGGLASSLACLPSLGREELLEYWHNLYSTKPPFKISNELLVEAIAYRMQEKTLGGLKPSTLRFLLKSAEELSKGEPISTPLPAIKSGTRLIREWNGRTYEVTVIDDGVIFKDKQYKSLSEVARIITGTRWSGPLFFGLKKMRKDKTA